MVAASPLSVDPCMLKLANDCDKAVKTAADYTIVPPPEAEYDSIWQYPKDATNPKAIAFTAVDGTSVGSRMEWIQFVAAFFNKEHEAAAFFNRTVEQYNRLATAANSNADAEGKRHGLS